MKGRKEFTKNEANAICKLIEEKLKADSVKQKSIRQKIRTLGFYASDFGLRNGYTVDDFRRVVDVVNQVDSISFRLEKEQRIKTSSLSRQNSDEAYIINICDDVLHFTAKRQYKFSFLKGDTGKSLPVDAYYEEINLVIEYYEKQHTEEVHFFDKRITASGISRAEQRRKYDELRKTEIPKYGLSLVIFDYSEFQHTKGKRLVRNLNEDYKVIEEKLRVYKNRADE